ncbi:MAG: cytidylate kinase-like family protein [Gemmatimonadota bacterium]
MIITISRQYGAGGSDVAQRVAAALGWSVVDNELVEQVAERAGVTADAAAARDERTPGFIERLTRTLAAATPELFPPPGGTVADIDERTFVRITEGVVAEMAARGRVVLVGLAAPAVLGQQGDALHVKLVAERGLRVHAAAERLGMDAAEAGRIVDDTDAMRARYHREYYGRDWADPAHYHMVLNTGLLGMAGTAEVMVGRARGMGWGGAGG